jgi:protein arginine kinase
MADKESPKGLDRFSGTGGEWLKGEGPEADIVISTRVRLARNVEGFPFMTKISPQQKTELERLLRETVLEAQVAEGALYVDLDACADIDRQFLVERHLISRDLAGAQGPRGVMIDRQETMSIMVNEEDHLRLQVIQSGLQLDKCWEMADRADDQVARKVQYVFSSRWGFLTVCPTNVGTGLRVSVMMHLPALVITKHIDKVFDAVTKINLAVRGLYGEGTQALSDFFQISNQTTLGKPETAILDTLRSVVPQIIKYEREARNTLMLKDRIRLEDRVGRAYGILKHARSISSEETLEKLSALRLGVNLGLIGGADIRTVNELFILTQPAHLQKLRHEELEAAHRDVVRADFIRSRLA